MFWRQQKILNTKVKKVTNLISTFPPRYGKKLKTRTQHDEPCRRVKKLALANRGAQGRKAPQFSGVTRVPSRDRAVQCLCRGRTSVSGLSGPGSALSSLPKHTGIWGGGTAGATTEGAGPAPRRAAGSRSRSPRPLRRRAPPYCGVSPAGRAGAERSRRPAHPHGRREPVRRYSPGEGRAAAA